MDSRAVLLDGKIFTPSTRRGKKYDVYTSAGAYITSFGAAGFQHYFDRVGLLSHLNHLDEKRRADYRSRHRNDHIDDPTKAGFYSWRYLW